ncbi:DUF1630-domain-containing protein [Neolentinus lepideus HHB14362 ss-1]|uniref:DUF1630-domain-containing protein n=1 Tax=Neolentinus lepideus HHB14362 ss-1 TaxID=1314782 RepID=A0A165P2A7_9AGAM|nr:DUF1630-domain-containing protein [Neolentinus lepideus HHB14362 ss-1]
MRLHSPARSRTLPRAHRRSSQNATPQLEPDELSRVRRWILGFATVNFDLEFGPTVESVYPYVWLSPSESDNIAFSSFPDCPQFEEGTQSHSFRLRDNTVTRHTRPGHVDRPPPIDGFLYGFSHFSQYKDTSSKRGYSQRSLVILTHHPYPALFYAVINILGPLYSQHRHAMLETACHNIANWPDPVNGASLELGFLGSVFQVNLPGNSNEQQLSDTGTSVEKLILAATAPSSLQIITILEELLSHLWSIWECVVLCEPILIYAPSPNVTSEVAWWLRDIIRPIPLSGDFRPYFTIHDQDHSDIVNKMPPKAGLIIGITNPLVERACKHWPHLLSLGCNRSQRTGHAQVREKDLAGPKPGWTTKTHNRYTSKDRALLKKVEDACHGDDRLKMEASLALRRHFGSRTNELLVPLHRYLNTLIPSLAAQSSPSMYTQRKLKPFSTKDFLTSLKANGSPLPFRSASRRSEFYSRWLRTPAFGLWLAQQEEVVEEALRDSPHRH